MPSIVTERLQHVLNYWKDCCWLGESAAVAVEKLAGLPVPNLPGPILYWREFEHTVFDNRVEKLNAAVWFIDAHQSTDFRQLGSLQLFPFHFFEWSRKSRRVYHLPASMHHMFAAATFPNIKWKDVLLPFDSFAITLEDPIKVEESVGIWTEYDTILVTRFGTDGYISLLMLRKRYENEPVLRYTSHDKELLDRLMRRGDLVQVRRQMRKLERRLDNNPGWRSAIIYHHKRESLTDRVCLEPGDFLERGRSYQLSEISNLEEERWRYEPYSWAAKIVVGWCLYLRSLSPANLSWTESEPKRPSAGKRGTTGVISDLEHICTVIGSGTLDPLRYGLTENNNKVGSGFFKRPHWRRAHARRERGAPPNAPRTVEIPPLLVREDLIPYFGIIGGTNTKVLPDE